MSRAAASRPTWPRWRGLNDAANTTAFLGATECWRPSGSTTTNESSPEYRRSIKSRMSNSPRVLVSFRTVSLQPMFNDGFAFEEEQVDPFVNAASLRQRIEK